MQINLTNNKKTIDDGAIENVSFNGYDIYDAERQSSNNVRLSCNMNVICDGSLFNPITEVVEMVDDQKKLMFGFSNIKVDTPSENICIGADIFNLPSLRLKKQPFLENQKIDVYNFSTHFSHYVKQLNRASGSFDSNVDSFTNIGGTVGKFNKKDYRSLKKTYIDKLSRKDGWFGFENPVSMRYVNNSEAILPDYAANGGLIKEKRPGAFIEMYPDKKLFSYSPLYSKQNKELEYNWLTFLTYPYKNVYDTKWLVKIANSNTETHIERYGLKVWFIDEYDAEITYLRTSLRNGFTVGDVVNVYSGMTKIVDSYEVVEKPDEYTIGINMGGKKFLEWNYEYYSSDSYEKEDIDTVYYAHKAAAIVRNSYINGELVESMESTSNYDEKVSIVKVDNQAECLYYIRTFKALPNKPMIKQNSFSKNSFGMDETSVMFIDDIDLSLYVDNLGRPLSDIYLTSIKNNEGYGGWYKYKTVIGKEDETTGYNKKMTYSKAFGEVNGGFVMDDFACDPASGVDVSHKYSIANLTTTNGRIVLSERNKITSEVDNGEFYGDLCEYSVNSFRERILQSFMHRFNTAQREAYKYTNDNDLKKELIGRDKRPTFKSGGATKSRYMNELSSTAMTISNYLANETNGYYYQPHQRIRIRTYGLDLTTKNAIVYKVLMPTSDGVISFSYGNVSGTGYTCVLSVEHLDDISLNSPLILYYMSDTLDVTEDMVFYGKMVERYDETLYVFMLDDKLFRSKLEDCVNNVENKKGKFYILRKPEDVPSQAILSKDRSFTFVWRELFPNGYDRDSGVEVYPFANNAFYVEKNINIYLRRQREVTYDEGYDIIENGSFNYLPESEIVDDVSTTSSSYDYENRIKEAETC